MVQVSAMHDLYLNCAFIMHLPCMFRVCIALCMVYALLTLGTHAHEGYSTLPVCLFVCLSVWYQSPGFYSCLYDKFDIPACSSLVFLGFQLSDFDKTVSFGFFNAFHCYFVVSSPYERFRILLYLWL